MKNLEFLFDFGSPTSYLAWTQVPAIAQRQGATVDYQPVLLGAIHKAANNRSPVMCSAKAMWMNHDLARFAKRYGVPLGINPHFPINTLLLMRGATALKGTDGFHPYLETIFNAMWVDPKNLNDPATLAETLTAAGIDPQQLLEQSSRQDTKDALRQATEAAVARGVFGAPTFFIGDEMHFGQDRLDFVEEALAP